jgi:UDP-N-acetylmuramoyl-tripeptide--D-alanyl-D-alanine ligase
MILDDKFIRKSVPEISFISTPASLPASLSFSIDTRIIQKDQIFVALKGNNVDGHDFVEEAFKKGAVGILIAKEKKIILQKLDQSLLVKKLIMIAEDPLKAFVQLATIWREQFQYPVIGITGSVGKTSTKELIAHMLSMHGKPFVASHGNQNTIIGVSLNVLNMRPEHTVAVFEMGINKRDEMAKLAAIVKPTAAIITNVGHCHMEGLGSIVDIAAEKRAIFKYFKEDNIGIVNGDMALLSQVAYPHPVIKFGSKTTNQVQARKINIENDKSSFIMKLYGQKYKIVLQKSHVGAVFNALATAAVGHLLDIPHQMIIEAIQAPLNLTGRFVKRSLKSGNGILIDDCYNANPESVKAALLAFENIQTGAQKIAVLGDMLELGVSSPFWHRQIGRFLRKTPSLRKIILVGSLVSWTKKTIPVGVDVEQVPSWKEAVDCLNQKVTQDLMVLVKGSFGMELKKLVDTLT